MSYFWKTSQFNTTFDLKINLGHSDLYLMVQWFLSFIFFSEKHFSFTGKARFRRATLSCDSSYLYNDDYSIDVHFDESIFYHTYNLEKIHFLNV